MNLPPTNIPAKAAFSDKLFQSMFQQHSAVMLLIQPSTGQIVQANKAALDFYGYSEAEMLALTVFDINMVAPAKVHDALSSAKRKESAIYEFPHRLANGEIRIVEVHGSPIELGNENLRFSIVHDITERKRYERDAREEKSASEATNHAKNSFLAKVNHEMRTPMNGILGMTQLLAMTPLDSVQREYVAELDSSAKRLMELLQNLLQLSEMESGHRKPTYSTFSIARAINEVISERYPDLIDKALVIGKDIAADVPDEIHGDQVAFRQVLGYLLGNAIKFTEQGSIAINAALATGGSNQQFFELTVRDTGIGISPEALQRIFTPFEQADNSITRRFEGAGLGLALAKKLIERNGGTIWAESEEGKGSVFHALFPLDAAQLAC